MRTLAGGGVPSLAPKQIIARRRGMIRFVIHPTPNPNSLKITTDAGAFIESGMESFASAEEAEQHELGRRLFSLTGVENVFILPDFLTITKHTAADWDNLLPKVELTLKDRKSTRLNSSHVAT